MVWRGMFCGEKSGCSCLEGNRFAVYIVNFKQLRYNKKNYMFDKGEFSWRRH